MKANSAKCIRIVQESVLTLLLKLLEADVVVLDLQLLDEQHGGTHVVEQLAIVRHQQERGLRGRHKRQQREAEPTSESIGAHILRAVGQCAYACALAVLRD